MSDPFKEFVEQMSRLAVPEDDTEENRLRREAAASESATPISELDESDLVASADDEFLCSETLALWAMIRKARELVRQAQLPQCIQTDGSAINCITAGRSCRAERIAASQTGKTSRPSRRPQQPKTAGMSASPMRQHGAAVAHRMSTAPLFTHENSVFVLKSRTAAGPGSQWAE
jgi:hypothetical protein